MCVSGALCVFLCMSCTCQTMCHGKAISANRLSKRSLCSSQCSLYAGRFHMDASGRKLHTCQFTHVNPSIPDWVCQVQHLIPITFANILTQPVHTQRNAYLCILVYGSCNGHPLFLSTRKVDALNTGYKL